MSLYCALCKKNGETESVFRSHKLRDENRQVTCPVLKQYTCPRCLVVGEHTASYCPTRKECPGAGGDTPNSRTSRTRKDPTAAAVFKKCPVPLHQSLPTPQKAQSPLISKLPSSSPSVPSLSQLPDSGLPQFLLDQILSRANKMRSWERRDYLLNNGYSPQRYLALQLILHQWRLDYWKDLNKPVERSNSLLETILQLSEVYS